jgi:hypothetical protein
MAHYHLYFVKLKKKPYVKWKNAPTFNDETASLVQKSGHDYVSGAQASAGPVKWLERVDDGWLIASDRPSAIALSAAIEQLLLANVAIDMVKKLSKASVFDFDFEKTWTQISNEVDDQMKWGHVQHLQDAGHTIEGFENDD